MDDEPAKRLKDLERENKLLKFKLTQSEANRERLEQLMEQSRVFLETVSAERLTEAAKKQLEVFSKFVPKEFLESLSKESTLDIVLGDHVEREMTVLFSDIFSFTSLSEAMSPRDNFNFINAYLKEVEPSIRLNRGFIDKFIGDAIMALFYIPDDAIKAGIDMQVTLTRYNETRIKESLLPIKIGVGLHTGSLMLGIIGVETRMQSTVIADAVNLASRLESLTRQYQSAMLISSYSLSRVDSKEYDSRFLGKMQVVGKTNMIEVFEILNAESEAIWESKLKTKPAFESGLQLYFDKRFAEASVQFTMSLNLYPEDKASQFYLKKSANYMVNGVPEGWCGTEIIEAK